jgi:DNA-binding LacI/PurR family transcriptional regulator
MVNATPGFRATNTTLRDIARAAGVSTASASRALSGAGGVSTEFQARIMAAATRLGYRPNLAARALVSRRCGLVGVVAQTLADPLFAGIVAALERRLRAAGFGTLLAVGTDSPDPSEGIRTLLGRGAEAFVFIGAGPPITEADVLRRAALPWVCVSDVAGAPALVIDAGRRRGGALAARYLHELGHRRFAVIASSGSGTRQGVATALAESGAMLIADGDAGTQSAGTRSAIRTILDRDPPPTAVVCDGDVNALATLRECSLRGFAVPGAISIVGFGDWEFARHATPALTTLRVSGATLGAQAGGALIAALRGESMQPFEAPVKLVVRESTGAPPG